MRTSDQILTAAQMVAAEEALIAGGETAGSLMQIAGNGAADWVWRVAAHRSVTVLCGPGNNGGDGYVIAEAIRARGGDVAVLSPAEPKTDAARNASKLYKGEHLSRAGEARGGVLVDCLFGSGLARPLAPDMALLLRDLARLHRHCIAVDLPSGIESDSGMPLNEGLPRNGLTIALGAWKFAHFLAPASAGMGARRLVPIGVSQVDGAARAIRKPVLHAPAADA
ncbi:MAG TPA: NAD(P)H-hydrate epimerase, partial [Alteraurantiacibacter sp.]